MQAQNAHIRAVAATMLASQGNRAAMTMIINALRSGRESDTTALLNQALGTAACPDEDSQCHNVVIATTNTQAPWVLQRKAAMIAYFEHQLTKTQ